MNQAITSDDFTSLMKDISDVGDQICVAVSGGADSVALCLLAHEWAKKNHRTVIGLSVDHGLRDAAQQECAWVGETLQSYGIEHHILNWIGDKPTKGIQAAARKARYGLLEKWCSEHNVRDVFLAHHLDDQAETFLLRLARGSGVDGLSAMQKISVGPLVRLLRPLLSTKKPSLTLYLEGLGQNWIEDPSNKNDAFERVKVRNAMGALAELGLTADRLGQTADNMSRARFSLEGSARSWLKRYATVFDAGYVEFLRDGLEGDDEEIVLRSLKRIGIVVGGEIYPPRLERLLRLWKKLQSGENATLLGCRWIVCEKQILICRELRDNTRAQPYDPSQKYFWDERFSLEPIEIKDNLSEYTIRALGEDGWIDVVEKDPNLRKTTIPLPAIQALVSIWDKQGVSVVPYLGYKRDNLSMVMEKDTWVRFNPRIDLFN